jgi:hypothetical protein
MLKDIIDAVMRFIHGTKTPEEVAAALDKRAGIHGGEKLDWRHSIIDLLKLVEMDSSLPARQKLAKDAGYVGTFTGSEKDNLWLHAEVMKELARQDIQIPKI